jgi:hypothetical protein
MLAQALQGFFGTSEGVAVMVKQSTIQVGENEQGEIHFALPVLARLFKATGDFLVWQGVYCYIAFWRTIFKRICYENMFCIAIQQVTWLGLCAAHGY